MPGLFDEREEGAEEILERIEDELRDLGAIIERIAEAVERMAETEQEGD